MNAQELIDIPIEELKKLEEERKNRIRSGERNEDLTTLHISERYRCPRIDETCKLQNKWYKKSELMKVNQSTTHIDYECPNCGKVIICCGVEEEGKEINDEIKREVIREVEDGERETNPVRNNSDDEYIEFLGDPIAQQ